MPDPSPARPRVLHLLTLDTWAGTEVQIATQVLRTDPAESFQAVAIGAGPDVLFDHLSRGGAPVWTLAGRRGALGRLGRLVRLLRRERFEIIAAYGFKAGLFARLAALLGGRPAVVIGVRGLHFTEAEDPNGPKTRFVLSLERALLPTVSRYDVNSRGARDFLVEHGFPPERFVVINNGVELPPDPAPHAPRDGEPVRIACVARFVPRKRHELLLRTLAALRDRGDRVETELIGYGITQEGIEALARELRLDDQVRFLGKLGPREIFARLGAADLFVLTSLWEGTPGSVLEAMAAGLPVVATDVNGSNEAVVHGETGLLVPPDDEAALAAAIRTLVHDPDRRRRMGAAGRERVAQAYSYDRVVEEKVALYREILAERGRRRGSRALFARRRLRAGAGGPR